MNPLDWDAYRPPQRNLHPHHLSDVNNIMEDTPRTNNKWDAYCEYPRHTVDEAHSSMMGVNVGRRVITPPPHNFYMKEPEVEDPDGEPLEMDEEDPELARKRKELREIEERIIMKKASIALKTVEPFVRKTTPPDYPRNEQSATCKHASLRDRVNGILRQRHPPGFFLKVHPPRERVHSSSLSKDGLLQDNHPLKLRVKALMKQRCSDPCVLPESREVPDVTLPSQSQSITSVATKDSGINEGFERFLSVLNKGVDMDFLSRIVNDDSGDLPLGGELLNVQPSAVENKSDPPFRMENQQSNCGASLPGHSQTSDSGKKTTDPPSQERPLNERHSLPDDEEKKSDRDFSSSRQSKSPLAGKKRTKKEDEKPKVKEQSEQLQKILKTLGLSLEVEEMSKLTDRTQERLYGKKHEDTGANSRGEQESQQRAPQRHYSKSSSSSSSSSYYSRSSRSRSFSRSPSRSRSRDRKRRSDRSRSRDRSRDELNRRDRNQHSQEEQRYRENKISTYQHPYQPNQMYPHPQPAAYPAYPDYSLSQDSQYTAYHSGTYSHATESYSTHTQGAVASPSYPSSSPYAQNTYQHYPRPAVAPHFIYPRPSILDDLNLLVNPDLSRSEGQTGFVSGPRCLQVISTKQQTSESCLKGLTKGRKRKGNPETCLKRQRSRWARRKEMIKKRKMQERMAKQNPNQNPVEVVEAPQLSDSEGDSEAEQPEEEEEEKRLPTEEEVKAKLRKTLEAFNQKVKQKVPQPANSLTSSDQWMG